MKTVRDLEVWKKAHQLTLEVGKAARWFPTDKRFGAIHQLRRACGAIPISIVEGLKRNGIENQIHFLNIAESSLEETKY